MKNESLRREVAETAKQAKACTPKSGFRRFFDQLRTRSLWNTAFRLKKAVESATLAMNVGKCRLKTGLRMTEHIPLLTV